jgi:8-oxo-dGTP pyrophosphatase MutT (NUDIX family)
LYTGFCFGSIGAGGVDNLTWSARSPRLEITAMGWESWAAGVLIVAVVDQTPVVLLGRDARNKGGKWSDFAGGGEPEDACPRHTAVRELSEETGGVVALSVEDLEAGRAMHLQGTTPSGKVLHRYIVRAAYDPSLPSRFTGSVGDEKQGIAWFPLAALPPLRHVFWHQMRQDGRLIARYALTPAPGTSVQLAPK